MCLAVPGRIVTKEETVGVVDVRGNRLRAGLVLVPEAEVGDWVLVHAAVRETVAADAGVDAEGVVVRFTDFGGASLQVLVVYYTKAVAYDEHLAAKERINLAVMRRLHGLGLAIGPPT
jgi:hydrogenase assembly chaperone HypC/HupF